MTLTPSKKVITIILNATLILGGLTTNASATDILHKLAAISHLQSQDIDVEIVVKSDKTPAKKTEQPKK